MYEHSDKKSAVILITLVAAVYVMALYLAYVRGLTSTLEGESAMTAREFLRLGDWTVNHMNGLPDFDKPSFFYWLIALSSLFTGGVNEIAVRIPSLLASASIMFMFRAYRKGTDDAGLSLPLLAAFIFISCPKVFWMTQIGRMDMTLNMFCFGTLTLFVLYMREVQPNRRKSLCYWFFFVTSSFAVLTKGPVGVLVTWPPIFLFLAFSKRWKELRRFFMGWGIALFLLLTLPWYINACISTDYEFFRHFFLEESVSRFGNIWHGIEFKQFNRSSPGIYLIYFFTGFFPWSLILPVALYAFLRKKKDTPWLKWFHINQDHKILMYYMAWIFLFFSVCGVKRSDYILPLYPAASVITADFLKRLHEAEDSPLRRYFAGFSVTILHVLAVLSGLLITASLMLAIEPLRNFAAGLVPVRVGSHFAWFGSNFSVVFLFSFISVGLFLWSFRIFRNGETFSRYLLLLACAITATWIFAAGTVLAFIDNCKDMRPWCEKIDRIIDNAPLYSYHFYDEECAFYLDRPTIPKTGNEALGKLLTSKDKRIFVMLRQKDMKKLEEKGVVIPWILKPDSSCWRPLYLISNLAKYPSASLPSQYIKTNDKNTGVPAN